MALHDYEDDIRYMVLNMGYTIDEVSTMLRTVYGLRRGASTSNIYKFCESRQINRLARGSVNRNVLELETFWAVNSVGPTFGRKMLTGYLRSKGYNIGERLVGTLLKEITPAFVDERRMGIERHINPSPYFAEYAGHKIHMDQNEKLNMFGVTHVIASDGYSGKILAYSTMPVKNNCIIYDEVYRKVCLEYGLFDTVRVDFGKEFFLSLYQQENLEAFRTNTDRQPYIQSSSKKNHAVERLWVEINCRVNYPLKCALQNMENAEDLDMNDGVVRHCVSQFGICLSKIAMNNTVQAWNAHTIPGKGIPNLLFQENCRTAHVPLNYLPPADIVAIDYRNSGGVVKTWPEFGEDPLQNDPRLQVYRDQLFGRRYPVMEPIVYHLLNRDDTLFKEALHYLIDVTDRLS